MNLGGGGGVGGGREGGGLSRGGGGGGGDSSQISGEEISGSGSGGGGEGGGGGGDRSWSSQGLPQGHDPHLTSVYGWWETCGCSNLVEYVIAWTEDESVRQKRRSSGGSFWGVNTILWVVHEIWFLLRQGI